MRPTRLLIADAHQNMLEAIRRLMHGLFDVVVMVADEDSLVHVSGAVKPDLIIVDLSLPVSGADNVLRQLNLHDFLPPARVIALSIHDEPEAVREAFAAGATGFVLKRAAATDLLPAVNRVLQGETYVSPSIPAESRAAACEAES